MSEINLFDSFNSVTIFQIGDNGGSDYVDKIAIFVAKF